MALHVCQKGNWTLCGMSTFCMVAACITQVVTLSWRNWVQMTIPWSYNGTTNLQVGLWGACVHDDHCYGFHSEGQNIPWHLQTAVFLAMMCICMEVLLLALCFAELIYLWNHEDGFPLKKAELIMALIGALLSVTISGVIGLLVVTGYEQELWTLLKTKMLLSGPDKLSTSSRLSVSEAWGFQVMSFAYFLCFMFIAKIQLKVSNRIIRVQVVAVGEAENGPARRTRIAVISPSFPNGHGTRTPPPAYSPPPAYGGETGDSESGMQETAFVGDLPAGERVAVSTPTSFRDENSSFTLLL